MLEQVLQVPYLTHTFWIDGNFGLMAAAVPRLLLFNNQQFHPLVLQTQLSLHKQLRIRQAVSSTTFLLSISKGIMLQILDGVLLEQLLLLCLFGFVVL
jgi:hypothetical protein